MRAQPGFDRIARPYRWLEYLTLGFVLERCRFYFLPQLLLQRRALVMGDGDGRFLAALLRQNPHLRVDAVDSSAMMLRLLRERCDAAVPGASARLRTHYEDALMFTPEPGTRYDLVVTHFFLDCFTQEEAGTLVERITPALAPGALWLVSDFRIPEGVMRAPATAFVRALYLAFRLLAGLRATQLPDYASLLTQAGLVRGPFQHSAGGMLTTELWKQL